MSSSPGCRARLHPGVLGEARVPGIDAGLAALGLGQRHAVRDVLELLRESGVVRDRRRHRSFPVGVTFDDHHRIVVPGATLELARPFEVAVRDTTHGDAGGQGEGLLHTREREVDAVLVEVDRGARDPADDIDQESRIGVSAQHLGQCRDRVRRARRGLVPDDGHSVERTVLVERLAEHLRRDDLAHRNLELRHVLAQDLGDLGEALREGADHQGQHLRTDAEQRRLHQAAGGGRVRGDVRVRTGFETEGQAQAGIESLDQLSHRRTAVADGGPGELGENFGTNFGGTGDPEHGSGGIRPWEDRGRRPRGQGIRRAETAPPG